MKKPTRRDLRREKVNELSTYILRHEPNGMSGNDLAKLISSACRFGVSGNALGQILKPLVSDGTLTKSLNERGNACYVYTQPLETP